MSGTVTGASELSAAEATAIVPRLRVARTFIKNADLGEEPASTIDWELTFPGLLVLDLEHLRLRDFSVQEFRLAAFTWRESRSGWPNFIAVGGSIAL